MVFSIQTQSDSDEPDYNLKAIVDIGSNGIRFSISSTHPLHARILPCLYKDRAAISLFDSQHIPVKSNSNASSNSITATTAETKGKKHKKHGKSKLKKAQLASSNQVFSDGSATGSAAVSTAVSTVASTTNAASPTSPGDIDFKPGTDPAFVLSSTTSLLANTAAALNHPTSFFQDDQTSNEVNKESELITATTAADDVIETTEMTVEEAEQAAKAAASDKNDIPDQVVHDVVFALLRFKSVCQDFRVASENIKVVATEATREATNSAEFREAIFKATGWKVVLLSKIEEARCGAYGVVSSFYQAHGLFMDLGGGSTQLSWISCKDGEFLMSDTPVSLPYGAAALTRRLVKTPPENTTVAEATERLYEEIRVRLEEALKTINIPEDIVEEANKTGGYKLFVSGGGFRGLGNLLLSKTLLDDSNTKISTNISTKDPVTPNTMGMDNTNFEIKLDSDSMSYPIPIINGFSCGPKPLEKLVDALSPLSMSAASVLNSVALNQKYGNGSESNEGAALSALLQRQMIITGGKKKVFRVSERRAHQLPAVMLLVRALLDTHIPIRKVLFSQGGVREGVLFHDLPNEIRIEDPLVVATRSFRPKTAHSYYKLLDQSLPRDFELAGNSQNGAHQHVPRVIRERLIEALANTAFVHSSYPKELQARVAMEIAVTGVIANTHGLSHETRALLGLALCQRWGGEIPDKSMRNQLLAILPSRKLGWWALYVGHVLHVIGGVYPGGTITDKEADEKQSIFSLHTEAADNKCVDGYLGVGVGGQTSENGGTVFTTDCEEPGESNIKHPQSSKSTKKNKQQYQYNHNSNSSPQNHQDERFHFTLRIQASTTCPKTSAPMVRSRINNLEKKLKKLTKEFGNDACKVNVIVDWV